MLLSLSTGRPMSIVTIQKSPDGIATLTLNDPDRRNAMGQEMAKAFKSAITEIADDRQLRSLIVTGRGKAFAAGGDLQMLKAKSEFDFETNRQLMLDFYNSFLCLQKLKVPTIAAVNGHAIGAGLCVAMACDFRVFSNLAKLGFTFTKLALHPGMGATLFLPRITGIAVATDLLVSGRLFSADEAMQLGLVRQVVEPDEVITTALNIAQSINSTGPEAIADLLQTLRPSPDELQMAIEREATQQAHGYAREEFLEGVNATIEKRPPQYSR